MKKTEAGGRILSVANPVDSNDNSEHDFLQMRHHFWASQTALLKSRNCVAQMKGSNYPTWKVQCRMLLMKEGLWSIVNGTETAPVEDQAERLAKFVARKDRALAMIVTVCQPDAAVPAG